MSTSAATNPSVNTTYSGLTPNDPQAAFLLSANTLLPVGRAYAHDWQWGGLRWLGEILLNIFTLNLYPAFSSLYLLFKVHFSKIGEIPNTNDGLGKLLGWGNSNWAPIEGKFLTDFTFYLFLLYLLFVIVAIILIVVGINLKPKPTPESSDTSEPEKYKNLSKGKKGKRN